MRIYVAGPMRGIPQFNFPAFDSAAAFLRGEGHIVFNPADRDRDAHGEDFADANHAGDEDHAAQTHGFNLREALAADAAWICEHAEAIALLPGWENSKGANAELALSRALGHTVIFMVKDKAASGWLDLAEWEHDLMYGDHAEPSGDGEVRAVSATGGEKGTKPQRYDLIPTGPLHHLATLYGRGALKYEDRNWERGYPWSQSFAALQRHAWAFWSGVDLDDETGLPHLAAVAWHAFALLQFADQHGAYDDRPGSEASAS